MSRIVQDRRLGEAHAIKDKGAKQDRSHCGRQSPEPLFSLGAALDTCANCRHRLLPALNNSPPTIERDGRDGKGKQGWQTR